MSDFDNLPSDFFRTAYIAKVEIQEMDKDLIIMNKFGGSKPFLYIDEEWPINMSFICQYKHPIDHTFVQFFLNLNDMEEYIVRAIDTKKVYKLNPIVPIGVKVLPIHKIISWQKKKELIDIYAIHAFYMKNIDKFKVDFDHDIKDIVDFKSQSVYSILEEAYIYSHMFPQCPLLKINGTPYSEEDGTAEYLYEGMLMQIGNNSDIKLPFKVGHITIDNLAFIYEN